MLNFDEMNAGEEVTSEENVVASDRGKHSDVRESAEPGKKSKHPKLDEVTHHWRPMFF